jgi:hypothetical protein
VSGAGREPAEVWSRITVNTLVARPDLCPKRRAPRDASALGVIALAQEGIEVFGRDAGEQVGQTCMCDRGQGWAPTLAVGESVSTNMDI